MILDLLIITLMVLAFCAGWWCRAKFGSANAMVDACAGTVKGWLSRADKEKAETKPSVDKF